MSLTLQQTNAIDQYLSLKEQYPELFAKRALRQIVTDRKLLEEYAIEHDVVLGVAATTPYVYFLLDLIEIVDEQKQRIQFPHFRLIYKKQLDDATNTVVIGTIANSALGPLDGIVMLRQERHATGQIHLELPRGFGELNLSGEENALQELKEETGFTGETAILLGKTYTDTGAMDAIVSFYHVPITGRGESAPNMAELIKEVQVLSVDEVWTKINSGEVADGFTLQALALIQHISTYDENGMLPQLQETAS